MPGYTHLIICSALTAALLCILFKRKRLRKWDCPIDTVKLVPEFCNHSPAHLQYHIESVCSVEEEYCLDFTCEVSRSSAKVTYSTGCLVKPKLTTLPTFEVHTDCLPIVMLSEESMDRLNAVQVPNTALHAPVKVHIYGSTSDSGSDHPLTPDSDSPVASDQMHKCLPPGGFDDPINDIYEANPEEMYGTMIPKVLIPSEMWAEAVDKDIWHETFWVPAHMGGVLIGRLGKNVRELKNIWQAEFTLNTCPGRQDTLVFRLSCPLKYKDDVLNWVSRRFRMRPSKTPIGNPNQLKRYLPFGEPVPVHVRSLYAAKEFFVTIRDSEYPNYLKMQSELDSDYTAVNNFRMQLCEPVTSGTIAVVPHSHGLARAVVISVHQTWPKTVFYFLLDHGTFGVVALNKLHKIRAKYMRIPFQAIHVSWAHAFPVFSDVPDIHILRTYFTSGKIHAYAVRMETCCRAAVAFGEPYPAPYAPSGLLDVLVTACNSGLYMAVPLALHSSRQCWLNGTSIPYYPFNYSPIDYSNLVSFIAESDSPTSSTDSPALNGHDVVQSGCDGYRPGTTQYPNRGRSFRGGVSSRRPYRYPGRWSNMSPRPNLQPQKENETNSDRFNQTNSKLNPTDTNDSCSTVEPKRRPLSVRNFRGGSGAVNFRGSSRGRIKYR